MEGNKVKDKGQTEINIYDIYYIQESYYHWERVLDKLIRELMTQREKWTKDMNKQ